MHWLVYVTSPTGPRPQRWTHDPAQASHEARAGVIAVHAVAADVSLDEMVRMFPAPAKEDAA